MKKFDIVELSRELRYKERFEIQAGCTLSQSDINPEILESYDTREEALEALKGYGSSFGEVRGNSGIYYLVYEYYIEEAEYDEDGERIDAQCTMDFSKMQIEIVDKHSYEKIQVVDNMKDAQKALDEYDGDAYLSCEGWTPAPPRVVHFAK